MAGKGVRSRVLFDYTKPELHGYMYKQGGVHKAFKKRYFVLYPGYLVYYADENKYRIDVANGSLQVIEVHAYGSFSKWLIMWFS